jgi:hypothetical protein
LTKYIMLKYVLFKKLKKRLFHWFFEIKNYEI